LTKRVIVDLELPASLAGLALPPALDRRLHALLDKQDCGEPLTIAERSEAVGLADITDFLSMLRLRAERRGSQAVE
jgi:hypothetical protein